MIIIKENMVPKLITKKKKTISGPYSKKKSLLGGLATEAVYAVAVSSGPRLPAFPRDLDVTQPLLLMEGDTALSVPQVHLHICMKGKNI